jgi:hypothetical protein
VRNRHAVAIVAAWIAIAGAATGAQAQVTTCTVSGQYALTASLFYPEGPYQLGGVVVFTPPATCSINAVGTAVIDAVYAARSGGPYLSYRETVPYRFDGTFLHLNEGLAIGALSGIADGVANAIVIIAGDDERSVGHALAGTMVRQAAFGAPGPQGPPAPPGLPARSGQPAPRATAAPPAPTAHRVLPEPLGRPDRPGPSGQWGRSAPRASPVRLVPPER